MPLNAATLKTAIFNELKKEIMQKPPAEDPEKGLERLAAALATAITGYFSTTQVRVSNVSHNHEGTFI